MMEALAMGLLGAAQGAGSAIADISTNNIAQRQKIDDEQRRQQMAKELEEWKADFIAQRTKQAEEEKAAKLREATSDKVVPYEDYDKEAGEIEGLSLVQKFGDLSPAEQTQRFVEAGLTEEATGLLTKMVSTKHSTDEEIRKDAATQKTKQHTPVAVGNGGAVFANGQMIPNTNQAVSVVRQSSTGGSGGGASSGGKLTQSERAAQEAAAVLSNLTKGMSPTQVAALREYANTGRLKVGGSITKENQAEKTQTWQDFLTRNGLDTESAKELFKTAGTAFKLNQAPASPGKNSGGTIKAPYPDGTRLRGKDGKYYVVKNGKPVLE